MNFEHADGKAADEVERLGTGERPGLTSKVEREQPQPTMAGGPLTIVNPAIGVQTSSEAPTRQMPQSDEAATRQLPRSDATEAQRLEAPQTVAIPTTTGIDESSAYNHPTSKSDSRGARGLRRTVLALLAVCVLSLVGLVALYVEPSWFAGLRYLTAWSHLSAQRGARSRTSTSASQNGAAFIASIHPNRAAPGQSVSIAGHGFISSNGVIIAQFGTSQAPTRCPSAQLCVATVPQHKNDGQRSILVRVKTEMGWSNAVGFNYR